MIVDDHPGMRTLIRQIATSSEDIVCECGSGGEAVRLAPEFRPDFVTMDVRMPGLCGIEATRLLRTAYPPARIAVVTTVDQPDLRCAAKDAGAWAFLSKERLSDLPALVGSSAVSVSGPAEVPAETEEFTTTRRIKQLEHQVAELESDAAAAHDLRASLQIIGNSVSHLQKVRIGRHVTSEDAHLARIDALSRTMNDQIERLLAAARSHQDPLKTARIDTRPLVLEALDEVCPEERQDQVDIGIDTLPHVQANHALLRLVFVTLLANALKRSASREHPRIEVGCRRQDGETAFFIRDNGESLDMCDADRLFQPARQLDSTGEFAGMGLVNVHHIVQRHGGRIWVETGGDRGTTFFFTLPATL